MPQNRFIQNLHIQWLIAILLGAVVYFFYTVASAPNHSHEYFPRFAIAVSISITLLAACMLQLTTGEIFTRISASYRYAAIGFFASYILGYVCFALTTLI